MMKTKKTHTSLAAYKKYPRAAIHACMEIVVIAVEISKQPGQSAAHDLSGLHERLCGRFDSVIKHCKAASLPDGAARELLYPLAALADEVVLSVPHYRFYWSERLLQLRYFGEAEAGTKFFLKLEKLMNGENPKKEVLEFYFISLALGLKGMYGSNEARQREKTFQNLGAMLKNIRHTNREAWSGANEFAEVDKRKHAGRTFVLPIVYAGFAFVVTAVAAAAYFIARKNLLNLLEHF
ncbi:MAG: DotU family type IV/VI secretion system protein [Chitinispirillales bacterium]|jgi:type IV/VI secretion system ImpK/VasF family protein|nr:DotU family type IV/VI secretion system protein [Chitinispirillales bacterium]